MRIDSERVCAIERIGHRTICFDVLRDKVVVCARLSQIQPASESIRGILPIMEANEGLDDLLLGVTL